jgi:hypothetical protein
MKWLGTATAFIANISECGCRDSLKRLILETNELHIPDFSPLQACPKLEQVEYNSATFHFDDLPKIKCIPKLSAASFNLHGIDDGDVVDTSSMNLIPALEKAALVCECIVNVPRDVATRLFFAAPCCRSVQKFAIELAGCLSDETHRVFRETLGRTITSLEIGIATPDTPRARRKYHKGHFVRNNAAEYWDVAIRLITSCTSLKHLSIDIPGVVPVDLLGLISGAMINARTFRMISVRDRTGPTASTFFMGNGDGWTSNNQWTATWNKLRVFEVVNFPDVPVNIKFDVANHCPNLILGSIVVTQ